MMLKTLSILLALLVLVQSQSWRGPAYRTPRRRVYLPYIGYRTAYGEPGYFGRQVARYGGAGAGPMYADGEGPPGTRERHAAHGHYHPPRGFRFNN